MTDNIKDIEKKGYLKAILKNEYPRYISKDFSKWVMVKILSTQKSYIKTYVLRVASAFIFGIFTLFIMDSFLTKEIQYSETNIINESMQPSKNVSTDSEDCKNINDKDLASDIIECKWTYLTLKIMQL